MELIILLFNKYINRMSYLKTIVNILGFDKMQDRPNPVHTQKYNDDRQIDRQINDRFCLSMRYEQEGLSLIEIMIVVIIIGILAAVAYPSYQSHVVEAKRAETMSHMQNIANDIASQKLQRGSYTGVTVTTGNYPAGSSAVYNVAITPTPLTADWTITATPLSTAVNNDDGVLTLNSQGVKCRIVSPQRRLCGFENEWQQD